MTERHVLLVVLALAGTGLGALAAHLTGVTSWLDGKVFLAVGTAVGLGAGELVARFRN
jgi:hypothetical protein